MISIADITGRGPKKFGDDCVEDRECGFAGSYCEPKKNKCTCKDEFEATNHIDKCGHRKLVYFQVCHRRRHIVSAHPRSVITKRYKIIINDTGQATLSTAANTIGREILEQNRKSFRSFRSFQSCHVQGTKPSPFVRPSFTIETI